MKGQGACRLEMENVFLFRLARLNKKLFKRANRQFTASGLSIRLEQLPLVMILQDKGNLSQQEIAEETGRDKASIQRTVQFLVRHNYVEIRPDAADRRKKIVCLTEHGQLIARQVIGMISRIDRVLFSVIDEKDKVRLLSIIDKLTNRIGKYDL